MQTEFAPCLRWTHSLSTREVLFFNSIVLLPAYLVEVNQQGGRAYVVAVVGRVDLLPYESVAERLAGVCP